jgi:hypothetical protein
MLNRPRIITQRDPIANPDAMTLEDEDTALDEPLEAFVHRLVGLPDGDIRALGRQC